MKTTNYLITLAAALSMMVASTNIASADDAITASTLGGSVEIAEEGETSSGIDVGDQGTPVYGPNNLPFELPDVCDFFRC